MLCDMAGAGMVYNGEKWRPSDVKAYFKANDGEHRIIHRDTRNLFEYLLDKLASYEKDNLKEFFKWYKKEAKRMKQVYNELTGENLTIYLRFYRGNI